MQDILLTELNAEAGRINFLHTSCSGRAWHLQSEQWYSGMTYTTHYLRD